MSLCDLCFYQGRCSGDRRGQNRLEERKPVTENQLEKTWISRRSLLRNAALVSLASAPVLKSWGSKEYSLSAGVGPAQHILPLDQDWLFAGKATPALLEPAFDDSALLEITLPHCVVPLSWRKWDPQTWEGVWVYRRHFSVPSTFTGMRLFLHFDRVMAGATPMVNGSALPQHLGGFLPFEYEITSLVKANDNILSVAVDSRWLNVPPSGSAQGPPSVDYLLPGGISGSVSLRAVPTVFIRDVFAKPVNVLAPNRRLDVICHLDASMTLPTPVRLQAALFDRSRIVARTSETLSLESPSQQATLTLDKLENIALWNVDRPQLYELVVTLLIGSLPLHHYRTRIGLRDARFEVDGFFLNGSRLQIFGLNRHELYPYIGFSAPNRLQRRDAEILRHLFNCNTVRCSHYPQSEAFLDACDELGLMVWEETPGWQYVGDESFQNLVLRDVEAMVRRDRNHPSIVIWGVRINESANEPELYQRTRALAKSLDPLRPTSGTMTPSSARDWKRAWDQDVFAYDDYHSASDGSVGINEPEPGIPYLIAECVGQFNYGGSGFGSKYRRAGDPAMQIKQALRHAEAHSKAGAYSRCAGVIAWCAFDYASLMNDYNGVKCPGVADVFRIPKLGAAFYQAQVDPVVRPVIEPDFCWDFGLQTPAGPGERAAIFSNCDRLEVFLDGKLHAIVHADRLGFPYIKYPPFFADLTASGAARPELRIDGYVGDRRVLSRSFSSDRSEDVLWVQADDHQLQGDGSDTTRLAFGVRDKFGVLQPSAGGQVDLDIKGPGMIVGDNPFPLGDAGGAGAVWIKTLPGQTGRITVRASHPSLHPHSVEIDVRALPAMRT